ncbi:MAG: GNAT family N-acetyltransferase [Thaumarchaeota archaeon]|nr:GNAT family N-acetyltransferase [Nitrososphaerota archaeon]
MTDKIESNDLGFTAIWSKTTPLECGTLFMNPKLPDDLFFDKLSSITCLSEKMIDDAISIFQKNNMRPFVYVLNDPRLEEFLLQKNFKFYDTQYVLKKHAISESERSQVLHIEKKDSLLWAEVFCKSYDCYEWINEVNDIVRGSLSQVEYLVDAKYNASCVALYEKNSILGLYCLGTLPEKRKKGLAKLLVSYALDKVKIKNLDFLMLETYQRDELLGFYSKLGFEKVYEKKIYTI